MPSDQNRNLYLNTKKEFNKLIENKKRLYMSELNVQIINSKTPKEFWNIIKTFNHKKTNQTNFKIGDMYEHYKNIFNKSTNSPLPIKISPETCIDILDNDISLLEMNAHIQLLKNNKSPGQDLITNEFLKSLSSSFNQTLLTLFNTILNSGQFPYEWSEILIYPIHKSGSTDIPSNFRPISLITTLTKVFTSILNSRLNLWCDENNAIPEEQAGFSVNFSLY